MRQRCQAFLALMVFSCGNPLATPPRTDGGTVITGGGDAFTGGGTNNTGGGTENSAGGSAAMDSGMGGGDASSAGGGANTGGGSVEIDAGMGGGAANSGGGTMNSGGGIQSGGGVSTGGGTTNTGGGTVHTDGGTDAGFDAGMAVTLGRVVTRLQLANLTATLAEAVSIEFVDAGIPGLNAPEGAMQSAVYETDIRPGLWTIEVKNDDNQLVGTSSVSISQTGVVAVQPVISIIENTPVVTKLNRHSGLAGDTVVATGLHLNRVRSAAFTGASQSTLMANGTTGLTFVIPVGAMTGPMDFTYLPTAKRVQASDFFSIQRIYYVRTCLADGGSCPADGGSGISFDDALSNIPDQLTGVQPGSEIWIAEGTYVVPRTLRFIGTNILGGFSATNPERDPSLRTPMTHVTTFDGNNSVAIARVEQSSLSVLIDGVHFTRGVGDSSPTSPANQPSGGALTAAGAVTLSRCSLYGHINTVMVVDAPVVMRDCVVRNNTGAMPHLGAVYVRFVTTLSAERCWFTNNTGPTTLYSLGSTIQLQDCIFDSNNSTRATIFSSGPTSIKRTMLVNNTRAIESRGSMSQVTLQSVVFLRNVGPTGALFLASGDVVAENVVWIGSNFAFQTMVTQNAGSLSLVNNTFIQNTSAISSTGGTQTVTNTVFFQTPNPFNLSATANAQGNIEVPSGASPFLRAFSSFDTATLWGPDSIPFTRDDAYVLIPSNANELIDKGVSTGSQVDIHGTPRPFDHPGVISGSNGTTYDIGASEAQ